MTISTRRKIVVTGVGSGLGQAMARAFTAEGHEVHGCGRRVEPLAALESELGLERRFVALDARDAAGVSEWAMTVCADGPPDLLINNAAVINTPQPLWEVPDQEFATLIEINVIAVFRVVRAFAPSMIAAGRGVIVNISSGWGRSTDQGMAPYCASKWAIEGLTRALADDLPPGMAAVPVNPGVIDTPMLRQCWGEEASHFPSAHDWARRAIPFLLRLGADDNGRPVTVP
ncbi:MAG: SDR family oxidoreductase [Acidobacteriota bacterium]